MFEFLHTLSITESRTKIVIFPWTNVCHCLPLLVPKENNATTLEFDFSFLLFIYFSCNWSGKPCKATRRGNCHLTQSFRLRLYGIDWRICTTCSKTVPKSLDVNHLIMCFERISDVITRYVGRSIFNQKYTFLHFTWKKINPWRARLRQWELSANDPTGHLSKKKLVLLLLFATVWYGCVCNLVVNLLYSTVIIDEISLDRLTVFVIRMTGSTAVRLLSKNLKRSCWETDANSSPFFFFGRRGKLL